MNVTYTNWLDFVESNSVGIIWKNIIMIMNYLWFALKCLYESDLITLSHIPYWWSFNALAVELHMDCTNPSEWL